MADGCPTARTIGTLPLDGTDGASTGPPTTVWHGATMVLTLDGGTVAQFSFTGNSGLNGAAD
jgi:hypothetical protein